MTAPQNGFPWAQTEGREGRQSRATPVLLFLEIERRYAFGSEFNIDVCAEQWNTKVPHTDLGDPDRVLRTFFSPKKDGLVQPWRLPDGTRGICWCNPPFDSIEVWLRKAIRELEKGHAEQVIMLVPQRGDRPWYHEAERHAVRIEALLGRVAFEAAPELGANDSAPFEPTCLIHLHGPIAVSELKGR